MEAWKYNDGGRAAAGYKGKTGDCVVRAIAIATGLPYREVYDELFRRNKEFAATRRSRAAKRMLKGFNASPRTSNIRGVYEPYLKDLGWAWQSECAIGSSERMHLTPDELPGGTIICALSKHMVAVIDGVVQDTYADARDGTRMVYGWYSKSRRFHDCYSSDPGT